MLGDALSVLAALIFGTYVTVLKSRVPNSKVMDLAMFWAFVGLLCAAVLWVPLPLLHLCRVEEFSVPSGRTMGLLVLNALIGSVLSDYLWAKSVVLTSALIGTIALSLTVPLSLAFDAVFRGMKITPKYALGALLVVSGFVVVNIEHAREKKRRKEAELDG